MSLSSLSWTGTVSISRVGEDEKILAVRGSGQFIGEMSAVSGSRSLLTARVAKDGASLTSVVKKVLSLMAKDTELGDILMGAHHALSRVLQESNAWLEEAPRVANLGYWVWDLETNQVIWSDESYRIFGLTPTSGLHGLSDSGQNVPSG
jgi:CRP-like cAMP-binding protein